MEIIYTERVATFIRKLPDKLADRLKRTIKLLEKYGHELRLPHSKALGHGLFELRIVGAIHIRLLYFFRKDNTLVVHAVFKKRDKLEREDIEFARNIMETLR